MAVFQCFHLTTVDKEGRDIRPLRSTESTSDLYPHRLGAVGQLKHHEASDAGGVLVALLPLGTHVGALIDLKHKTAREHSVPMGGDICWESRPAGNAEISSEDRVVDASQLFAGWGGGKWGGHGSARRGAGAGDGQEQRDMQAVRKTQSSEGRKRGDARVLGELPLHGRVALT